MELRCPICKSSHFLAFNGRDNARCAKCKAMERTRLLWLILERHDLFRPGLRVMHVAPELPLAKRYSELLDERYFACDVDAARYSSTFTVIRPLDLCVDLVKLPSRCFDLIIHSHVLEHLRCEPESVLREFERVLKPGGHHFLSVPVSGEETREDLSDELSDAERSLLFGQADHFRIFGRRSLAAMLDRVWGGKERHHIEPDQLFAPEELERAAIPREAWSGISSHSVFHHVRPPTRPVRVAPGAAVPASGDAAATFVPAKPPSLILHIGMPKAGTTSLQRWLAANRGAALASGLDYWDAAENHSELMFMAFADPARIAKGTMWFQRDPASASDPGDAPKAFGRFLDRLADCTGFVSAEVLWSFAARDVKKLADCLNERGVDALVLCWVRPPAEFMATAAQQRLRSALSVRDLGLDFQDKVLIRYSRLGAWIENFGRDNVAVLPLHGNIVAQARDLFARIGRDFVPADGSERMLNPSVSLLAAKALLALNGAGSEKASRRLRTILQELKGAEFRLPESVLRRTAPLFRKEARYLAEGFSISEDWLLSDATGVDDALFFRWDHEEVGQMLRALNDALAKMEETGSLGRD